MNYRLITTGTFITCCASQGSTKVSQVEFDTEILNEEYIGKCVSTTNNDSDVKNRTKLQVFRKETKQHEIVTAILLTVKSKCWVFST